MSTGGVLEQFFLWFKNSEKLKSSAQSFSQKRVSSRRGRFVPSPSPFQLLLPRRWAASAGSGAAAAAAARPDPTSCCAGRRLLAPRHGASIGAPGEPRLFAPPPNFFNCSISVTHCRDSNGVKIILLCLHKVFNQKSTNYFVDDYFTTAVRQGKNKRGRFTYNQKKTSCVYIFSTQLAFVLNKTMSVFQSFYTMESPFPAFSHFYNSIYLLLVYQLYF